LIASIRAATVISESAHTIETIFHPRYLVVH
jgi:hypothetical protein